MNDVSGGVSMSEKNKPAPPPAPVAAATKPRKKSKSAPQKVPPKPLPPWKVLLHNDDVNDHQHVIKTIIELTHLNEIDAKKRTEEADKTGVALLLVTHKERAELYKDQFSSKSLTVTIEPAE
jgi:ATP-dependent Clp protease adaptor protein ClpS